jgi:hypothetical protein
MIPVAGEKYLDAATAASKGPNYLMEEIAARVAKAPASFDWFAQVAQPSDMTDDLSTPCADAIKANADGLVRLLTHLVGTGKRWDGEAKRFGSFRFDHQFVLGRSLYRQVDRPRMRVWGSWGFPRETRRSLRSPCLSVLNLTF